ncbi:hypothetical protein GGU10DRAFT_385441 [Lentinula aff. detonsa]|uniref:Ribosomal RNA methyltransferase FtsJ domain-containing protein n=1 Tax=Lentinula aff. detonsa TaxID=2804958 RepID=A0AA38NKY0_9AGAR|nr:hypothetical protein GGU10DRAFT_385441 [Lentinula aff. detonsa]
MSAGLQSIHIDTVTGWENDDLQLLRNLKRLSYCNALKTSVTSPKYRDYLRTQQDTADNAGPDLQLVWLKKMKKIMNQIDNSGAADKLWVVPFTNRSFRFLDLGCCPGGFSTYILKKNKESTSVGVSLDPAQGGHPYLLEEALRVRQTVIFADMTTFQLSDPEAVDPTPSHAQPPLIPVPNILFARDFDLVLLDAHHLRNQTGSTHDLLAISQVLLALLSIKFGGTIVMKLASSPDSQYSATMAFHGWICSLLRFRFTSLMLCINEVIPGLRRVWECLRQRNSGPRGSGKERLVVGDLDFIVDKK